MAEAEAAWDRAAGLYVGNDGGDGGPDVRSSNERRIDDRLQVDDAVGAKVKATLYSANELRNAGVKALEDALVRARASAARVSAARSAAMGATAAAQAVEVDKKQSLMTESASSSDTPLEQIAADVGTTILGSRSEVMSKPVAESILQPLAAFEAAPEPPTVMEATPEPPTIMEAIPEPPTVMEAAPEPPTVMEAAPEPPTVTEAIPEPSTVMEAAPEPPTTHDIVPEPFVADVSLAASPSFDSSATELASSRPLEADLQYSAEALIPPKDGLTERSSSHASAIISSASASHPMDPSVNVSSGIASKESEIASAPPEDIKDAATLKKSPAEKNIFTIFWDFFKP